MATALLLLTLALQQPGTVFTGTLNDRLISEPRRIGVELKPSRDIEVPGLGKGDRVHAATIEMFKQRSAPKGLAVALVEGSRGSFLFIDVNLDGRLAESERITYKLAYGHADAQEVSFLVRLDAPDVSLPIRGQVFAEK